MNGSRTRSGFSNEDTELVQVGFNLESNGKVPSLICRKCDAWLREAAKEQPRALRALSEPTEAEEKKIRRKP